MTAITMEMGAELAPKKELHTSIGASSTVTIGILVILATAIFGGGWWGSAMQSELRFLRDGFTTLRAEVASSSATNTAVLGRLIAIETTVKTIERRIDEERDPRRRSSIEGPPNP